MNLPDKCPFCRADQKSSGDGWVQYDCLTGIFIGPLQPPRSLRCRKNECAKLTARVTELEARCKRLEEWKEITLSIEREWDSNAIALMLGAQLGDSQRRVIQREVPKLLERMKRLEAAAHDLYIDCIASGSRWTKQQTKHMHALRDVLEAKP